MLAFCRTERRSLRSLFPVCADFKVFRRCKRLSTFSRMWIPALVSLLFLCAAPGRRCRAEWDAVPHPAGALPPSPPRATAPLDGRNALRGRVYCFVQPADRLFLPPALRLARRNYAVRRTSAELGAGARPCRRARSAPLPRSAPAGPANKLSP